MSIHELMAQFEAEELQVQFLHEGDLEAQSTKHGTRIAFYTGVSPLTLMSDDAPIGMVVWLPRKRWQEIAKRIKGGKS